MCIRQCWHIVHLHVLHNSYLQIPPQMHPVLTCMIGMHNSVLKFCTTNKINALRIPLSLALALNPEQRVAASKCAECPPGAKSWDMLEKLFDKAAAVGILIVLDMHRMDPVSAHTSTLYTTHVCHTLC
jgi:hypothetical protein